MNDRIAETLRGLGWVYDRLLAVKADRRMFLVGGTIRDILMGREPADLDFAVSGSGLEFAAGFARKVHGKLVVLSEPDDEVRVVYRRQVVFDFNGFGDRAIENDIMRRDFTVNALAVEILPDGVGELVDLVHGREDIKARVIRPVSDHALSADPLRLLRGLRLGLELGFDVDEAVYEQGRTVTLARTAAERIGAELLRIMERPGSYPCMLRLFELGRLQEILPELVPVFDDPALREHTFKTYQRIEDIIVRPGFFEQFQAEWTGYFDRWDADSPDEPGLPYRRALLKLAGLVHDVAKPQTRFINTDGEVHFYGHDSLGARVAGRLGRERLRLSRAQGTMLKRLVAEHMRLHLLATSDDLTDRAIRRYFHDLGPEAFGLMILCVADGWATAGRTMHLEDAIARMIGQKREEDAKASVKRLVTGDDLIALGMKPGPSFKVILQELQDLQVEGRITTKEEGIDYLKTHLTGLAGKSE
jgi:poly(A) polymerase